MWLLARYQPVALFSLRDSQATASGAKSLLLPSPYAVKMAILDVVMRYRGVEEGRVVFCWLRDLSVALAGPAQIVVNNSFIKIAKVPKNKDNILDPRGKWPFDRTVAFRQFVYHAGEVRVSLEIDSLSDDEQSVLRWALARINYFGKRGGFFQFAGFVENPSEDEIGTRPFSAEMQEFPRNAYLQIMDDMGEHLTFEQVDITVDSKISERDRAKKLYLLPYKLVKSSKSYNFYQFHPTEGVSSGCKNP